VILGSVEPEFEIEVCFDVMPAPTALDAQLESERSGRAQVHLELAPSQTEVLVLITHLIVSLRFRPQPSFSSAIREPPKPGRWSAISEPTPRAFKRREVTLRRPSDGWEPIALPPRARNHDDADEPRDVGEDEPHFRRKPEWSGTRP
jgi:hypothetical protein